MRALLPDRLTLFCLALSLGAPLLLAGCGEPRTAPSPPPASPAPPSPAPAPPAPHAMGEAGFQAFVRDFEGTALAAGVRPDTYARAMTGIQPVPAIGQILGNQPEFARPVWTYLDSAVSARRVRDGQAMAAAYAGPLAAIAARSGVPRQILLAIWGMETDYGHATGSYNLFAALATLAYDSPRKAQAQSELIAALLMLQQQDYAPAQMVSSWAGAFGQTQFMPSSFFKYASDGDGDGRIDLWRSPADALASTAMLLQREGWQAGLGWGFAVRLPAGFDYSLAELDTRMPLSGWAAMGVRTADGAALPASEAPSAIYLPAGARGPAFLLFDNFRVLMKYNNAASYALAVGLLADRIAGAPPLAAAWPRDERPLSRAERIRFQDDLKRLGYDAGESDGVLGRRTRLALRQYQKARGLLADGFPTAALLTRLDGESPAADSRSAPNGLSAGGPAVSDNPAARP